MIYFSLAPAVYAARFDESIIILDIERDKYLSLIGPAAHYLIVVTESSFSYSAQQDVFMLESSSENSDELNYWIKEFLDQKYIKQITESDLASRKGIAPTPRKTGGLADYRWDFKKAWNPFEHAPKLQIIKTFLALCRVHFVMKYKGIAGLVSLLGEKVPESKTKKPLAYQIKELVAAVDAASIIYPKKSYCLSWAVAFVYLARKNKWDCSLVIGVQSSPFYAHAWAEVAGEVVHDDPCIAEVLSIIYKG